MKRMIPWLLIALVSGVVACADAEEAGLGGLVADSFSISSTVLGEEREVLVALPAGYADGGPYPVVYVLDPDWHFLSAVAAARFLAETSYISAHRVPPLILVGVASIDRNREDTPTHAVSQHGMSFPTSGAADEFLHFMRAELIPEIDRRYRTHPWRALAGWSLGGLLTTHALFEHPDVFQAHLAISPSLWWDEGLLVERGIELAASGESRRADLVLTIGTAEEGGLCYEAVHRLDDSWSGRPLAGLRYSLLEIDGEDHNHSPYKAYFEGLRALFADWFYPEEALAGGLDALAAHYEAMSSRRGYAVAIPAHLYDALARAFLSEGKPAEAIAVQEHRCARDPGSALSWYFLGETSRQAADDEGARRAYLQALELERAIAAPDTVFINWVEGRVAELDAGP